MLDIFSFSNWKWKVIFFFKQKMYFFREGFYQERPDHILTWRLSSTTSLITGALNRTVHLLPVLENHSLCENLQTAAVLNWLFLLLHYNSIILEWLQKFKKVMSQDKTFYILNKWMRRFMIWLNCPFKLSNTDLAPPLGQMK